MISLILTVAIVGFLTWLFITYVPMPSPFREIILAIVWICVICYVLGAFGIFGDLPIPQLYHHHGVYIN